MKVFLIFLDPKRKCRFVFSQKFLNKKKRVVIYIEREIVMVNDRSYLLTQTIMHRIGKCRGFDISN